LVDEKTALIRAPMNAIHFSLNKSRPDTTVFARASLVGESGLAWTKTATGPDTPWEAESVALVGGGIRSGHGFLKRHQYQKSLFVICANQFGYIYIPKHLITKELENVKNDTAIKFEAAINIVRETEKKKEQLKVHKWRAVSVTLVKSQDNGLQVNGLRNLYVIPEAGETPITPLPVKCRHCMSQLVCICAN